MKLFLTSPAFFLMSHVVLFIWGWIPIFFTFSLLSWEKSFEKGMIFLLLAGFIRLEMYFMQQIYLFFCEKKKRFLWIKISKRLKILWVLGSIPLFFSGFLWISSLSFGFTYLEHPLDRWISLFLFLSYYFLWFYPFFFSLQLYFSYQAFVEKKEMKSIAIAYIITYVGWVQSGILLIDLALWRK